MGSQTSLSLTCYGICLLFPWHHLHLMLFSLLTAFAFLNISSFFWLPKLYWVYRANHSAAEHGSHLTSVHCLVFIPMLFLSYPAFPLLFTLFIWHEVLSPCRINIQFLWAFKLWTLFWASEASWLPGTSCSLSFLLDPLKPSFFLLEMELPLLQ